MLPDQLPHLVIADEQVFYDYPLTRNEFVGVHLLRLGLIRRVRKGGTRRQTMPLVPDLSTGVP